jgi:hypothetical protein
MPAPVALFAYRRPQHLLRTIEALRANPEARETQLYVFSDGAKLANAAVDVSAVRALVRNVPGFSNVEVVCRPENFGLAGNITSGVSAVLERHSEVIVVEDDVVVSPHFLRFMNDALGHYRDEPGVGNISGYCYPTAQALPETFFIRGADCWGWATWRDRWRGFNPNGKELLSELQSRGLAHAFDFDGTMGFTQMLRDQIAGRNDSWAVRWHASCFLRDLLILYPGRSLVVNIGNDGSGTHTKATETAYDAPMSMAPVGVGGIAIEESETARAAFCEFFRGSQGAARSMPAWERAARAVARGLGLRALYGRLRP